MDLSHSGYLLSLYLAFLGGLGTSLTPCVYPLIPVTLALFGAVSAANRWQAFILSVCYVLGIALIYTALGMLSALSGSIFGQFLGSPITILLICSLLLLLSLYSLDLLQFRFLSSLQSMANAIGGQGFFGAFCMGAVSGFVAAPCAAPILIGILTIAAQSQSIWRGSSLLLAYSFGFGVLFVILGTFSGLLKRIPKPGDWLYIAKLLMATALLMVAIFIAQPMIKASALWSALEYFSKQRLLAWCLVPPCLLLAFLGAKRELGVAKLLGSSAMALLLYSTIVHHPAQESNLIWHTSIESALEQASARRRLVMVDFYADWCAACKEFERITFPDPQVSQRLSDLELVRIDMTQLDQATEEYQRKYGIIGLPLIIFLAPDGTEIKNSRLEGFLNPPEFLRHLNDISRP